MRQRYRDIGKGTYASGTTPERGLDTAIVAGFGTGWFARADRRPRRLHSFVFVVIQKLGYGGLIQCTLLAGMLIGAASGLVDEVHAAAGDNRLHRRHRREPCRRESLLSALVANGMIGGPYCSTAELVAQGIANSVSALFGGLPATGAIARTATTVRAAGMVHAGILLVFMLALAPLMRYVPLAALAAVLLVVAWNISEIETFRQG